MRFLLKVFISLTIVGVSFAILWLVREFPTTGYLLVPATGGLTVGFGLFFITLALFLKELGDKRKRHTLEFSRIFISHLFDASETGISDEAIYKLKEAAKTAAQYGVKLAKFVYTASPKTVKYAMEYLAQPNHLAWAKAAIESGKPYENVLGYLIKHLVEHQQIKDERDKKLAEKYLR